MKRAQKINVNLINQLGELGGNEIAACAIFHSMQHAAPSVVCQHAIRTQLNQYSGCLAVAKRCGLWSMYHSWYELGKRWLAYLH